VAGSRSWPEWGCKERNRKLLVPTADLSGVRALMEAGFTVAYFKMLHSSSLEAT
jgi:hypothetical protein